MPSNPNLPSTISMLMLGVSNLPESLRFYRDTLGLTLDRQSGEFAFFSTGTVALVLSAPLGRAKKNGAGAMEIIFPVESVAAAHALLRERGCVFVSDPHEVYPGTWAANFEDPDGHLLTAFGPL